MLGSIPVYRKLTCGSLGTSIMAVTFKDGVILGMPSPLTTSPLLAHG